MTTDVKKAPDAKQKMLPFAKPTIFKPEKKRALITGITGQDGSYLAEILLREGYQVFGIQRRTSTITTGRIDHLLEPGLIETFYGDLADANSIMHLILKIKPHEIYNIASMSHVRVSFDKPEYTGQITGLGPTRILEALRSCNMRNVKYYQASSSEMFGDSPPPQDENTPFRPQSPYGCAKLYAYWMTKCYRRGYGMFAANGILFNHESPRRGETFVTKKIVRAAARIKLKKQKEIKLGNLEAARDWGYAKDYMEAVYLIMQHSSPDDFVISTGDSHTVREFAEKVFSSLSLNFYDYLKEDQAYQRPNEVPALCGNSTKARTVLSWKPLVGFAQLIDMMVEEALREERLKENQYASGQVQL